MPAPHDYPKRILLAVSGLSPQILTETLYALAVARPQPFVPTEIHLITTAEGARRARLTLLHRTGGHFYRLCSDYCLNGIVFDAEQIHVVRGADGDPLEDIRTPQDNEAAADFITAFVARLTGDRDCALHGSIAGGRKTMGYYLGYALSLFGRAQDRLSHVLVSERYEGHPEFFYPTPASHIIHTGEGRPLDTAAARVVLAEIPFVRLRGDIPKALLQGRAGFSETIELARRAEQPSRLVIDLDRRRLNANGVEVDVPDILLAFYLWLLEAAAAEGGALRKPYEVAPDRGYAETFLAVYQRVVGPMRDIDKTDEALRCGMEAGFFMEKVSRINRLLNDALGRRPFLRFSKTYLFAKDKPAYCQQFQGVVEHVF